MDVQQSQRYRKKPQVHHPEGYESGNKTIRFQITWDIVVEVEEGGERTRR
jgi:hypothetical protein